MAKKANESDERYPYKLLLRMTDEQREIIERAADKAGMPVTAWIRHRMEAQAKREASRPRKTT
jgi:predicted HicB family RNase H-like nuclease